MSAFATPADAANSKVLLRGQDTVVIEEAPVEVAAIVPEAVAPAAVAPAAVAPAAVTEVKPAAVKVEPRVVAKKVRTISAAKRKAAARQVFARRLIAEAKKHYGKPYRWGATGPSSFDCSGFTGYVYRKLGKSLPRDSRSQYRATIHVSKSAKRVGDLIFRYSSSGRIYHVGIYAGGGKMINSTRTGDVVRKSTVKGRYKVGRVR